MSCHAELSSIEKRVAEEQERSLARCRSDPHSHPPPSPTEMNLRFVSSLAPPRASGKRWRRGSTVEAKDIVQIITIFRAVIPLEVVVDVVQTVHSGVDKLQYVSVGEGVAALARVLPAHANGGTDLSSCHHSITRSYGHAPSPYICRVSLEVNHQGASVSRVVE